MRGRKAVFEPTSTTRSLLYHLVHKWKKLTIEKSRKFTLLYYEYANNPYINFSITETSPCLRVIYINNVTFLFGPFLE